MPINLSLEPIPQREESTLKYLVNNFNRIRDAFGKAWDSKLNWLNSAKAFGGTVWSPIVQQGVIVAYNAGASIIEYTIIGELVIGNFNIAITGAGTAGQPILISLPATPSFAGNTAIGGGWVTQGGVNTQGQIGINGTNIFYTAAGGFYSPAALAAGNALTGSFHYRAL